MSENIDVAIRPKTLSQLFASKAEAAILEKANGKALGHSFLVVGPSGSGKTTTARAIASYLFTGRSDTEYDLNKTECYKEVNSSNYTGVDDMRSLLSSIEPIPLMDDKTIVVLDEAHNLSKQAQSALLKTLEEPPEHLYIVILTDHPEKLLDTVKNRCALTSLIRPSETALIAYSRDYAIPKITQEFEVSNSQAPWRNWLQTLDDLKLKEIITASDQSYRSVAVLIHDYLVTGIIEAMATVDNPTLNEWMNLLVNPTPGFRGPLQKLVRSVNSFEDMRIAICNYIGAVYTNSLTRVSWANSSSNPKAPFDDMRYKNVINTMITSLVPMNAKPDFIDRATTIIFKNAGLIT